MKKVLDELSENYNTNMNYDLEKAYDEALEDEKFKKLVMDLKVPRKELVKYTSILEKSALEYHNCSKCKNIFECKNKIKGYCYVPKIDDEGIRFEYKMCKYNALIESENKYKKNIYFSHISDDIKNASMDDIYTNDSNRFDTIRYLKKFIKDYKVNQKQKGLYLNGNFGCGKTYLISATFNELAKDGYKSAIVFWPEFLIELKNSFQGDFKEKYEYVKKVPLLLIDDIGAENTTEWSRDDIFCPLIQYRMENHLTTFFTSNLTIEELEEHFKITKNKIDPVKSRRIIERIKQVTIDMNMVSKNLRN